MFWRFELWPWIAVINFKSKLIPYDMIQIPGIGACEQYGHVFLKET